MNLKWLSKIGSYGNSCFSRGYPFLKARQWNSKQQWNISKFSYGNPLVSEPMGFSNHQSSWMEISRDTWG